MPKYRVIERAFTGADWQPSNTLVDPGAEVTVPEGVEVGSAYELVDREAPKTKGGKAKTDAPDPTPEPEPEPEPAPAADPALA